MSVARNLGLLVALGACGDNVAPGWHVARGALRAPDGRAGWWRLALDRAPAPVELYEVIEQP